MGLRNLSFRTTVCLVILITLSIAITISALTDIFNVDQDGTIYYVNVDGTPAGISWGGIYAGETQNRTITVSNTGTEPLVLSHIMKDFTPPEAEASLNFTWTGDGQLLPAGTNLDTYVILTIPFPPTYSGDWSLNMTIIGDHYIP